MRSSLSACADTTPDGSLLAASARSEFEGEWAKVLAPPLKRAAPDLGEDAEAGI
jgi:hypothetical protein